MQLSGKISIPITWLVSILVLASVAVAAETSMTERTLAADRIIKDSFQAGTGLPVGKIQSVRGETDIFHHDLSIGYRAKTGLPLYQGDILRTRQNGRIFCRLVDGSTLTMASGTELTLLQSTLNSARKSSESFLALKQGSVWFTVNPAPESTIAEFKVETAIAFAQAHTADFIVKAEPGRTEITNLEKSRLEVVNLADPEEFYFLSDYQRAVVRPESVFPLIETVSPTDAEAMVSSLRLVPEIKWYTFNAFNHRTQDTAGVFPEE